MKKVTVIIPVYNVENFIDETLDSILNQTLKEIEVICVNDGSMDNSLHIIKEKQKIDKRIRVYSQENKGQSEARNNGLQYATGKYVYFMDSDDKLDLNALSILYKEMEENNLDIIFFDGETFLTDKSLESREYLIYKNYYRRNYSYPGVYKGLELLDLFQSRNEYRVSPCLQMTKLDFLRRKRLSFHKGIIHEDNAFTFQNLANAERVGYVPCALFYRRIRNDSTMTKKKTFANLYGYYVACQDILEWRKCHNRGDVSKYDKNIDLVVKDMKSAMARVYRELSCEEKKKLNDLSDENKENIERYIRSRK